MNEIIDVSYGCGAHASYLAGAGIKTLIRYYSRDTSIPSKRLTHQEAQAFASAGIRLGVVHEARHGNQIESFSPELGTQDAAYALAYARDSIGQPEKSAIYFAVDLDASPEETREKVLPYFRAVNDEFHRDPRAKYQVGVYGSGAVCSSILDEGLAQLSWLAQSTGWRGYKAFDQSNRWSLKQLMPSSVGEIECDPNVTPSPNGNFGSFFISAPSPASREMGRMKVSARAGLRVRSGPGVAFDVLQIVPFGTIVHTVKIADGWTQIDLRGDGRADGFVNSHFLIPEA